MKIEIFEIDETRMAEVISDQIVISNVQDALDLMADCNYQDAGNIIVHQMNLTPGFFDLKTGIAGEILQKFSNYRMKLAIVGDFSEYKTKSLRDFIYESNKTGRIIFAGSSDEAKKRLL